jgi:hypothetical protein
MSFPWSALPGCPSGQHLDRNQLFFIAASVSDGAADMLTFIQYILGSGNL